MTLNAAVVVMCYCNEDRRIWVTHHIHERPAQRHSQLRVLPSRYGRALQLTPLIYSFSVFNVIRFSVFFNHNSWQANRWWQRDLFSSLNFFCVLSLNEFSVMRRSNWNHQRGEKLILLARLQTAQTLSFSIHHVSQTPHSWTHAPPLVLGLLPTAIITFFRY